MATLDDKLNAFRFGKREDVKEEKVVQITYRGSYLEPLQSRFKSREEEDAITALEEMRERL